MATEIERKYLPKDPHWRPSGMPQHLVQGYFWPGEMAEGLVSGTTFTLTLKNTAATYSISLPEQDAAELHAATHGQLMDSSWTLRIRTENDNPAGIFCIKGKAKGISRPEYEYLLTPEVTRALLPPCRSTHIVKDRYTLELNGYTWEVDVYASPLPGDPAVTIEVELPSEETAPALPHWVGEEISHNKAYTNAAMARRRHEATKEGTHGT